MNYGAPILAVGALILTLLLFVALQVANFEETLRQYDQPVTLAGEVKMAPDHSTSWVSSRGTEVVNTTCDEQETEIECEDRHDARVARRQKKWPPIE